MALVLAVKLIAHLATLVLSVSTNMAFAVSFRRLLARILFYTSFLVVTRSDRVKDKMYESVQGDMACFKRFNGTQEIGCTSKFHGNSGVIHVIHTDSDLRWVLDRGPHEPYVLAIIPQFFTTEVLQEAQDSGKVSGVVVMVDEDFDPGSQLSDGFSGEHHCPNEQLGLYNDSANPEYAGYCQKNPWNHYGTSLLYESWNFPVFLVDNQTSIDNIRNCYEKYNEPNDSGEPQPWPLCCLELKSNMFGTTNTEVCMRRRSIGSTIFQTVNYCDPLADHNIWGSVKPMNSSEVLPEKSVIIVATRMDAATMFDNISPGANSAVSGLVTLMATAEALYRYKDEMAYDSNKNVLFVMYQGETWGYIGSSRMVWNMEKGEFPFKPQTDRPDDQMSQINFTHIEYFIELDQIGQGMTASGGSELYLHTDPISNADPYVNKDTKFLLTRLESVANQTDNFMFEKTDESMPLPPASLQSFLKRVNISGVVITDHKNKFNNLYYESIFDDYQNVKYNVENGSKEGDTGVYHKHISRVAGVLATTLYTLLGGETRKTITADEKLTNDLLYCYMKNVSCSLFREYGNERLKPFYNDKPAKMYVSVRGGEVGRTYLTEFIFAGLLGDKMDLDEATCKTDSFYQVYQLYYFEDLNNGTCIRSTVRKTEAMSPAFYIEDYNWQSGEYSTWTESGWEMTKVRIFLKPSLTEEIGLVCGGVVCVVLSVMLVYFMNSRADLLFGLTTPPAAC